MSSFDKLLPLEISLAIFSDPLIVTSRKVIVQATKVKGSISGWDGKGYLLGHVL